MNDNPHTDQQQNQQSPENRTEKRRLLIASIIIFVVVIAVIMLITRSLQAPGDKQGNAADSATTEEMTAAQEAREMNPVAHGEFTYQFEGIDWQFEPVPQENRTQVHMQFEKFSRRNDVYVTFGNPYSLGEYAGTCEEVEMMNIDPERETGIALAFAECWADDTGTQIAIFQEGQEVVVKTRRVDRLAVSEATSPQVLPDFNQIYAITLTEVVR